MNHEASDVGGWEIPGIDKWRAVERVIHTLAVNEEDDSGTESLSSPSHGREGNAAVEGLTRDLQADVVFEELLQG
jgi:hypothetical protein